MTHLDTSNTSVCAEHFFFNDDIVLNDAARKADKSALRPANVRRALFFSFRSSLEFLLKLKSLFSQIVEIF